MAADGSIKIDTKIDQKGIDQGVKTMQKKLQGAGKKMQGAGKTMSKYVTAPLVGLGTAAFAAADNIDKAYRDIQVGSGATGEELEALKQSFDNVFVDVPDSAEAVANSLANLNTYTGATGDVLEGLTQQVLDASRTLGEDGVTNSEAFGKALQQWQIPAEEGEKHLDYLYTLTQDYGVGLGQVSDHLTTYGAVLNNAGFEMEESADLMARMEANGISVSRVMPGLNSAFRRWAGEGKNTREELDKVIDSVRNAETDTEALTIATEEFGAEGAQRLMTAIRNGAIPALDELGEGMEDSQGTIQETTEETRTIGEEFQILANNAMTALQPLGEILIDLAKTYLPPLIDGITRLAEWIRGLSPTTLKWIAIIGGVVAAIGPLLIVVGTLINALSTVIPIIVSLGKFLVGLANPVSLVITIIAGLVTLIIMYWDEIKEFTIEAWTVISEFLIELWNSISETVSEVWNAISEFFVELWNSITETFSNAVDAIAEWLTNRWESIKENISTIWNGILDFFGMIWDAIVGVVQWYIETVKTNIDFVFNTIKTIIETIWNTITTITSTVWDTIVSVVTNIINRLSRGISNIFNGIKEIISTVWDTISSITSSIWDGISSGISTVVNTISDTISRIFNRIKRTISNVWDSVKRTTSRVWDSMVGVVKGPINAIIELINGMINGLNNVNISIPKVPDWIPGIGGRGGGSIGFSIPNIPYLDTGTDLVTRDGLAMIHAGEKIVPAEHNGPYTGGGKPIVIENVMNVDGEEVARITEPYIDSSMSDKVTIESYLRGEQ